MFNRRALLAAVSTLAFAACDGSGGGVEPPEVVSLVPGSTYVVEGTLLTLALPAAVIEEGHQFEARAYEGTISSSPVTFARVDAVTVGTVVPAVGAGTAEVTIDLGQGYVGQASVTVAAGEEIADPSGLLAAEVASLRTTGASGEPLPGFEGMEWETFRSRADSVAAAAEVTFAALGPAERLMAARLLQSVAAGEDPFGPSQSLSARVSAEDVCAAALTRSTGQMTRFFIGLGLLVAGATMTGTGIGTALGLIVGTVGAVTAFNNAAPVFATVAEMFGQCGTRQEIDFDTEPFSLQRVPAAGGLRFTQGGGELRIRVDEALPLYLTEQVRPVDGTDADDPKFALIAQRLDELHAFAADLPFLIRGSLPPLPPRLTGAPPRPLRSRTLAPAEVRIENVSVPDISIEASPSGDALLLTASGVDLPVETPVTFDLVTVQQPQIRKTVHAIVVSPQDSTEIYERAALGMWTVTLADGTGEPRALELFDTDAGDGWMAGKYYTEPTSYGSYEYCPNGPPVENGRCAYDMTWMISRSGSRYYLSDSGFWHPAFGGEDRDPLTMPITGFTTYSNYSEGIASRHFTRN